MQAPSLDLVLLMLVEEVEVPFTVAMELVEPVEVETEALILHPLWLLMAPMEKVAEAEAVEVIPLLLELMEVTEWLF